ncbi:MAG: hypothetical protein BAJALOKI2v1_80075 [Promethearchaeota archaeon]|nr:MAG: hypothetical protein BAJALOKI2v1_80075 [Candidatus Lokiarchaeota archaeon]
MNNRLLIKNGLIYDPINSIDGVKKDILIEGGKIVEKFSSNENIKEINASQKTVIPSGIDIHTHISSQQLNWARLLGEDNKQFQQYWKGLHLRKIAKDYISNGYTFVLDANVFPSLARQSVFNLQYLPVLDKAFLLNVSNIWALESQFERKKPEEIAIFLADLMEKVKAFGVKLYNPFEAEEWNYNVLRNSLSEEGKLYNFSALDVYEDITRAVEHLNLPHSSHAHIEGYESKQGKENLKTVLTKINNLDLNPPSSENIKENRSQIFHIAHSSSYNIDGNNSFLIDFLNQNQKFDTDLGLISFDPINPLITSDRRLINSFVSVEDNKINYQLIRANLESEGDIFAMLRTFEKNRKQDCLLWANALDIAFNVKNKWQLHLSTNYPNYGDINKIPEGISWLVSSEARKEFMKDMNNEFLEENNLAESDGLDFNDIVVLRSAAPARSMGLANFKGHLGIGADGDLNILNINIDNIDLEKDYLSLINAFKEVDYVIKSGIIVKKNDTLNLETNGKLFWSKGRNKVEKDNAVLSKKKQFYQKYYSVFYESFQNDIDTKFLREI